MKVHETTKELQREASWTFVLFIGLLIGGLVGFVLINSSFAVPLFALSSVFGFVTIIITIKIHTRYVQELLCKINNKKLLDYCECDFCKLARK